MLSHIEIIALVEGVRAALKLNHPEAGTPSLEGWLDKTDWHAPSGPSIVMMRELCRKAVDQLTPIPLSDLPESTAELVRFAAKVLGALVDKLFDCNGLWNGPENPDPIVLM